MPLRAQLKRLVGSLGYDVRSMPTGQRDSSQVKLLQGRQVSTIFDVGASIGETVATYRRLFPQATVYAFEPLPDCYSQLALRFQADARVNHHRLAVTDHVGVVPFHSHEWRTFSSISAPAAEMQLHLPDVPESSTVIDVEATTLDGFCEAGGVDRINVLKLDVQGAELAALRGADKLLERRAIDLVFAEVSFVRLYQDQALFEDVMSYLRSFGYALYNLYDIATSNGFVTQADALFLSPEAVVPR